MFALFWNLSAALRGYLRCYMPTNRIVVWLRACQSIRWEISVALWATLAYLFATSICVTIVERGGPGYLNVCVLLFAWNATKFAILGVLAPLRWFTSWSVRHRAG